MACTEHALFQRKTIAPERELCAQADGQWNKAFRIEFQPLPFEMAEIQGLILSATLIERKLQVSAMDRDGCFQVVEEHPAVSQEKLANVHLEELVVPSPLCRSWTSRSR